MTELANKLLSRLHPAWVGLVGFALYAPTVRYDFVSLDDPWLIRDNRLLHELSARSVWTVLTDLSWEQRYRLGAEYLPVRDLSVMLDYAVYGDWVGGQHLTQVLLYGGTCALLASLALALFYSRPLAWLTGLLFATHPVHVEAVAWLSERKGVLSAFLLAASLLAAVSYLRCGGWRRATLACALVPLAIGAKALTVAGLGALVLVALWVESPLRARTRFAFVTAYWTFGLLAFVPNLWVSSRMGVIVPYHGSGFFDTLVLFFGVHQQYLALMAYVGPYAIAYPIQPGTIELGRWLPGAVAAVLGMGMVAWAVVDPRRRNAANLGLGWWFVFLAPVSHLLFPVQNIAADRYLFLPSFGLLLGFASLLVRLPRSVSAPIAVLSILVGCGWTVVRAPAWSTSDLLFESAIEVDPTNASAWGALAESAERRGEHELAWDYTTRGLDYSPGSWVLLHRRGLLLAARGEIDAAIATMAEAASGPESHKAYANLALLLLKRGDREQALEMAKAAVRLQAETSHNQRVLGIVAYEVGDVSMACRAFERAAALDPYDEDNMRNLELCTGKAPKR